MISWTVCGLTFHLYGLVIGLAGVVGWSLAESQALQAGLSARCWRFLAIPSLVGGLMGARGWYVVWHWSYYQQHLGEVWAVWLGGSSIVGGLIGGGVVVAGSWWLLKKTDRCCRPTPSLTIFTDSLVFGLPIAQAIGRLGNWLNQELYGWPTSLPWAIYIDPKHRLPGFEDHHFFHPLFAYEAIAMLILAGVVWLKNFGKNSWWPVGSGHYFYLYIIYYSITRFLLDFIRIDKIHYFGSFFSQNQLVMLFLIIVTSSCWLANYHRHQR